MPDLGLERSLLKQGHVRIAGVDEVGRGSWAGPVVAAAVILPLDRRGLVRKLDGLRDSKEMTARQREKLSLTVFGIARIGIGWASHHVVDREGLAFANRAALLRAVANLPEVPDALLLDHFRLPGSTLPQVAISHGDSLSLSIAAASVVAKVLRDRWMTRCGARFPEYGFEQHKGYGTRQHRTALTDLGPCPLHRRSFMPVLLACPS
ncbi:MAG: ribonuclease HII [Chloroflexota bacterium]